MFVMTLRNKYFGKLSFDIDKEEIDLIKQAGKRIDKIEELKKDVMRESKAGKILEDLEYKKIDEIVAIADKISNIKKTNRLLAPCFKNNN